MNAGQLSGQAGQVAPYASLSRVEIIGSAGDQASLMPLLSDMGAILMVFSRL